jgi:hypothetical protein
MWRWTRSSPTVKTAYWTPDPNGYIMNDAEVSGESTVTGRSRYCGPDDGRPHMPFSGRAL